MANYDASKTLTQCPVCLQITEHSVGNFKAREQDGLLFDAALSDADALKENNKRFETHMLVDCAAMVSQSCAEEFVQLELLKKESPLRLFLSQRVRALKCPVCGHLTKLSRLP